MGKKKLQVEGITNELEGASLYFSQPSNSADLDPPKQPKPETTIEQIESIGSPPDGGPFFCGEYFDSIPTSLFSWLGLVW